MKNRFYKIGVIFLILLILQGGCNLQNPEKELIEQIDTLRELGENKKAYTVLEDYLTKHPDSIKVRRKKISLLIKDRLYLTASDEYLKLIKLVKKQDLKILKDITNGMIDLALREGSPDTRMFILDTISQMGRVSLPYLKDYLKRMLNDSSAQIQLGAANLLKNIDERARSVLLDLAESDDQFIRVSAIDSLSELKDNTYIPVFKKAITSKSWMVRSSGYRALGRLKTPIVRPELEKGKKDKVWFCVLSSAFGLINLGKEENFITFRRVIDDKNIPLPVKQWAVGLLGELKSDIFYPIFNEILKEQKYPKDLKLTVARVISPVNDKKTENLILLLIENKDKSMIETTLKALSRENVIKFKTQLLQIAKNPKEDETLRGIALSKLAFSLPQKEAKKLLRQFLKDNSKIIVSKSIFLLASLGDQTVIPLVTRYISDDDPKNRLKASLLIVRILREINKANKMD